MLETGIQLYVGRPGAGKSLVMVSKLLDIVQKERRPIYTNLPLQWRVVKLFLHRRGGAALAGLIRPLTERHFRAFLDRFAAKHAYVEERRGMQALRVSRSEFDAASPPVIEGLDANWIPAGSLIVVDEAQHWFPNPALKSSAKPEPPALLSYLTMHRHMLHQVWFATQAARQVSATIKSLAIRFWEVSNMGDEAIVWGLRWRHVGITACGYRAFDPMEWGDGDDPGKPLETFVMLPNAPWNRWLFRLYSSFTHAGSPAELKAALQEARTMSGVSADGKLEAERKPKRPVRSYLPAVTKRRVLTAAAVLFGAAVMYGAGATSPERSPPPPVVVMPDGGSPAILKDKMVSWSPRGVRLSGGKVLRLGDTVDGVRIMFVSAQGCMGECGGDLYAWVLGAAARNVGRAADVCAVADGIDQAADRILAGG